MNSQQQQLQQQSLQSLQKQQLQQSSHQHSSHQQSQTILSLPNEIWYIIFKYLNIDKQLQNMEAISALVNAKEKQLDEKYNLLLEQTIDLNEREADLKKRRKSLDIIANTLDNHIVILSKLLMKLIDEDMDLLNSTN